MTGAELAIISLVISAGTAIYAATLDLNVEPDDIGANIQREGVSGTKNVFYGTTRTGSVKIYSNVNNTNSAQLLQVYSFGLGVSAIRNVYIDDVQVIGSTSNYRETPNGGNNQLRFAPSQLINGFNQQVTLQLRAGLETGVPMQLAIDNSDGEWTTEFRGDDVSCIAILSERVVEDGVRITSGNISVSALVNGVPIHDPRYHSTGEKEFFNSDPSVPAQYRECGRNVALCLLDYLTSTKYGVGIDNTYINEQSFIETATWCDDNGFKIDGEVSSGDSFATNIQNILNCANLKLTIENGEIHCHYEDIAIPSQDFDHDNILNGSLVVEETSSSTYFNVIEAEYKNSLLDDKEDTYTLPSPANTDPQVIADGRIIASTLSMPLVRYSGDDVDSNNSPIKKLTNRELKKAQFQRQVSFDTDLLENPVSIFEVITITDENLGWVRKEFRVNNISKSLNDDQGINIATIKATEYDDSIYTGGKDGGGGSQPLPKPPTVSPVAGLVFDQTDYITEGYGTLSWQRTFFNSDVQYIVDYKQSSSATWTRLGRTEALEWQVARLPADTYDFRVFTVSAQYGSSAATVLADQIVSGLGILPPVTGAAVSAQGLDFEFSWDDMLGQPVDRAASGGVERVVGDVFAYYRVALYDNSDVLLTTVQATTNEYILSFTQNSSLGLERIVKATVEIVALDGSRSRIDTGSRVTANNAQVRQPTIRHQETSLSTTVIEWDDVTATDYRATRIYESTTSGFTPSDGNLLSEQVGTLFTWVWSDSETHYLRIAHVDRFGNDLQNYTAELNATPREIDLPFDPRFQEIRDPDGATGSQQVFKVADGEYVTGIGIYANEVTEDTTVLVAADNFLIGSGGRPFYDASKTYNHGDNCLFVWGSDKTDSTGLYQNLGGSTGVAPSRGGNANWIEHTDNVNKAVFAVQSDGRVLIENAVIENLNGSKITVNTLRGDRIIGSSIEGSKISSSTTIVAGSGNNTAGLNGYDAVRSPDATNHDLQVGGSGGIWGFRRGQYGTLSNSRAQGAEIIDLYSDGTNTYLRFARDIIMSATVTVTIQGVPYQFSGANRQWTIASSIIGAIDDGRTLSVSIQDNGNFNPPRIWAGTSFENSKNANLRIDVNGDVYTGNLTVEGGSMNINDRFVVDNTGQISITQEDGNVGMKIDNGKIDVYDESGVLRVRIGKLN